MDKQNFMNGLNKFPVSTETFDFIQKQIYLVARFAEAIGANVIITYPTANADGLVIVGGELLPFSREVGAKPCIEVVETKEDITAGTQTFEDVRISKKARYSVSGMPLSSFTTLQNMVQLMGRILTIENTYITEAAVTALVNGLQSSINGLNTQVTTIQNTYATQAAMNQAFANASKHYLPKRTVIDWYGGPLTAEFVPYGFVPCGKFLCTQEEQEAWAAVYPAYPHTEMASFTEGGNRYVRFARANGCLVPDLTDRFIVQAGFSYNKGDTGGQPTVTLTVNNMPSHNHGGYTAKDGAHTHDLSVQIGRHSGSGVVTDDSYNYLSGAGNIMEVTNGGSSHKHAISPDGGGQPHDNMPPYFGLYKLMKVI